MHACRDRKRCPCVGIGSASEWADGGGGIAVHKQAVTGARATCARGLVCIVAHPLPFGDTNEQVRMMKSSKPVGIIGSECENSRISRHAKLERKQLAR